MKISKLFHWLYACVMFLPLLVIPIFSIYTINHEPTPLVIERDEFIQVNFNQLNENAPSEFNIYGYRANSTWTDPLSYYRIQSVDFSQRLGHIFIGYTEINENTLSLNFTANNIDINSRFTLTSTILSGRTYLQCAFSRKSISYDYIGNVSASVSLFDLTQMFGEGNEPTYNEFWDLFEPRYYDYTLSEPMLVNVGVIEYNDTDIGSQYLYSLYHTTDKYFNFDDVLNLGAITEWLDSNVFSGSTPIGFTIVWHYLDYWLIVSIFWLCFDVLIYVPQLAHRWLDKASLE